MSDEGKNKNEETIVLVHGTFAGNTNDTGTGWWQRGGSFGQALIALLGSKNNGKVYECAPEGEKLKILPWWMPVKAVPTEPEIRPDGVFHWSGANSEVSRQAAAELLLKKMEQYEKYGPYHIISHSHGGSVLWEALRLATKRQPKQEKSQRKPVLPRLQSWTTLGTPFLHYRPELEASVLYILPLLAAGFVTWWTGRWVFDYWDHSTNNVHQTPWVRALLFVVGIMLSLFTIFILLRLIFALPRYALTKKRDEVPALVEREWQNLISCLLATVFIVPVVAFFFWRFGGMVIDATRQYAMVPLINTIIWAALSVTFLFLLTFYVVMPIIFLWARRQNRELHKLAWAAFSERGLIFACDGVDEAINGLKAIEKPPRDPILPRIALSKASLFGTVEASLESPEREIAVQSKSGWAYSYVVLPISFFIDWVLGPTYNHIVAGIIDDYVRRQLHRAAHGCDIVGLTPHKVYSHPTEYFSEVGQASSTVNSKEISDGLERKANEAFTRLASEIREQLSYYYPNGRFVGELLKESMKGGGCPLVHTLYYENEGVIEYAASRIIGNRVVSSFISKKQTVDPKKEVVQTSAIFTPTIWESSGYWIAMICSFALLLLPPSCLWLYSYLAFYEYSDDYHVAWANDARPVLSVANDMTTSSLTENASQTPLWVRWWLAQHLHGQGIKLQDFAVQIEDKPRRMRFLASVSEKMISLNNLEGAIEAMRLALLEAEQPASGSKEFLDYSAVIAKAFYIIKNIHLSPQYEKYLSQLPKGQANGLFAKIEERLSDLETESSFNYFDATPEHLTHLRKVLQRVITVEDFVAFCTGIPNEVTAMQLLAAALAHVDIAPSSLGQLIKGMDSTLHRYTDKLQRMDRNAKVKEVLSTPKVISSCLAAATRAQFEKERLRLLNVIDQQIREYELMVPRNQQSELFITTMKAKYVRTLYHYDSKEQIAQAMTGMSEKVTPIITADGKAIDDVIVNLHASLGEYYHARKMSEFRSSRARLCSMLGILENELFKRNRADSITSNRLRYALTEDLYQ